MIKRRGLLAGGAAATAMTLGAPYLRAAEGGEIKIGNTMPYSGPASSFASIGKTETAVFDMVNRQGGIAGHKITFISLDDGYSPPRTVEDARRLIEEDKVDFLFQTLGTPTSSAIERYCNQRKVPQLFIASGADKWGDYQRYPWSIGLQPSYRTEAQIYAKYALKTKPDARIAILYQNDDYGKDYLKGVRDVLGNDWDKHVVKTASYEATDPTIDSQVETLQNSGANVFICVAAPKSAAQAIRKVHTLNWKPLFFMTNTSVSPATVMKPAGAENGIGIITGGYIKDGTDPAFKYDPGIREFAEFLAKYMPGADIRDSGYVYGYMAANVMLHVLRSCNGDFSRENVMKQATNIRDLEIGVLLPGIKIRTSPTNYHPMRALQLMRWDGATWQRFGEVIEGAQS